MTFFQCSVMLSFKMLIFRGGGVKLWWSEWILTSFHHWLLLPLGKSKGQQNPTRETPDSRHYHQVLTLPMHGLNLGWQNLRLGQLGPKNKKTATAGLMQLGLKYQKIIHLRLKNNKKNINIYIYIRISIYVETNLVATWDICSHKYLFFSHRCLPYCQGFNTFITFNINPFWF